MAKFLSYEKTSNFIDYSTGEITSKEETRTFKIEKNSEQFFKFFVNSIGNLYALSATSSFKVLFAILHKATSRDNRVNLRYGMKSFICETVGIHINSFSKALNEIVDKGILIKTDVRDYFIINPRIFGQGSIHEVERLRQSVEFDWDFKEGVMKQKIRADSITSTGMDILQNPHQYEISNIKQEENEDNSNLSVSVRHKDNNKGITPYPTEPSLFPVSNNAIEEAKIEESDNADDARAKKYNDMDRLKYESMIKSFETTSKMLDRIKDLHTDGKKDEAMALQKDMQQYINSFSTNKLDL